MPKWTILPTADAALLQSAQSSKISDMSVLHDPRWADVHRRLRDELENLTETVLGRLRAELAGYARMPPEALRAGVRTNLDHALTILRHGGRPTPADLRATGALGTQRAQEGVPVDDVLRAWRIAGHELWMTHLRIARELGVDEAAQLEASRLIGEGVDLGLAAAATGYRAAGVRRSEADVAQRVRLLRGLMVGTSSAADMELLTSGYQLPADGRFRAVRCRPTDEAQARDAERALTGSGAGLVERLEQELVGVLAASAAPRPDLATGVGCAVALADLPRSFAEATAALDTALAFELTGAVTVDELGVKVAVATRPEIGARLSARFVDPLLAGGPAGLDTLDTVTEHLRGGLRVNRTAQALFVHPNTVRHRLRRFEDATGARLDDIEDVVGVWWALRHHEIHRAG